MTIDTNENRFHALKFAIATPGVSPHEVVRLAADYEKFLDGKSAPAPQVRHLNSLDPRPSPEGFAEGSTFLGADLVLYKIIDGQWAATPFAVESVELADLTNSYPADEPFVPPLGSGPEGSEMADVFAPEPVVAVTDSPLEDELFEEGPHEMAFSTIPVNLEGKDTIGAAQIYEDTSVFVGIADIRGPVGDSLSDEDKAQIEAIIDEPDEPTFEYVAAAVQEIASPPPPTPDTTDEPELTDEQVERAEERLATLDPITAAEADPDRQLETVTAYVNVLPRHKRPWMG